MSQYHFHSLMTMLWLLALLSADAPVGASKALQWCYAGISLLILFLLAVSGLRAARAAAEEKRP